MHRIARLLSLGPLLVSAACGEASVGQSAAPPGVPLAGGGAAAGGNAAQLGGTANPGAAGTSTQASGEAGATSGGVDSAAGTGAGGSGGAASTGFVHPGILVSQPLLDFVKGKIAAGAEPWKS